MASDPSKQDGYRPDIDGLRAVAVLAVVLFHLHPAWLPGGFIGVDVFFVISGFLITSILLKDLSLNRFSIKRFYERRIIRIFPSLITVLIACLVLGYIGLFAQEFASLGKHIWSAVVFVTNIVLWREAGYFDTESDLKPLLHLWSLAVEEQFYIFWPLILAAAWKSSRRTLAACIAIIAISFAVSVAGSIWFSAWNFFMLPTRAWELLAGALLAIPSVQHAIERSKFSSNARSAVGFALLILGLGLITGASRFPGALALLPVVGTALILSAGAQAVFNRALLNHKIMIGVGLISYPLYLWHWPLLAFVRILEGGAPIFRHEVIAVGIAFLAATATYFFVERPLRFTSQNRSSVLRGLIATFIAVGIAGVVIKSSAGFKYRASQAVAREYSQQMERAPSHDQACDELVASAGLHLDYCRYLPGEKLVAIIGDSHADVMFPGFAEVMQEKGYGVLMLANSSCPALLGSDVNGCGAKAKQVLEFVAQLPSVQIVLWVARGPVYITGRGYGAIEHATDLRGQLVSDNKSVNQAGPLAVFKDGLKNAAEYLQHSGKKVSVLMEVPELGFSPVRCIPRAIQLISESECGIERTAVEARQHEYREMLKALANETKGLQFLDSLTAFCSDMFCSAKRADQLLYLDDDHVSRYGSTLLAKQFFSTLQ